MCGIAGALHFGGEAVGRQAVDSILEKLQHRGRDSTGLVGGGGCHAPRQATGMPTYPGICLGHRRLSIIDLSVTANQPMAYGEGRLWLTFNGEIYNYVELRRELRAHGFAFRTQSDTEVVLAAYDRWGEGCVEKLNGMFAFALWDEARQVLFCSRDPIGIKPFYYYTGPRSFIFASESRALAHLTGNRLSSEAVAAYLLCNYVPGPLSIFDGIKKLEPGSSLTVHTDGRATLRKFWRLERSTVGVDSTEKRSELEETIHHAVGRQLRSDVPVGAFLSGGIDSGMVVASAARQHAGDFHTFSVAYEGHPRNELPFARQLADRYGTRHHELYLASGDVVEGLNKPLGSLTEPIADSAIVPIYLLCKMAEAEGVKVLLNGTGGDEVFGGYERYDVSRTVRRNLVEAFPLALRTTVGRLLPMSLGPAVARLRHLGFDLVASAGGSSRLMREFLGSRARFSKVATRISESCFPRVDRNQALVYSRMFVDLSLYLPDQLLLLLDQMSMAFTLEGRVPLVDIDVIRLARSFPSDAHVQPGKTKILLRELASPLIGSEIAFREKQGFGGPVPVWIKEDSSKFLEVIAEIRSVPYFDGFRIESLMKKTQNLSLDWQESFEVFQLFCLICWYDHTKKAFVHYPGTS